ncbi:MAG TPA: hypothetical protein VIT22_08595 [Pseudoxanthomonas sp.]
MRKQFCKFTFLLLSLCASLIACASGQSMQGVKRDFNGAWSAQWCDEANPQSVCGKFDLYLIQDGDRICGQHFVVAPGLSRLDEGDPGSVLGTFDAGKQRSL